MLKLVKWGAKNEPTTDRRRAQILYFYVSDHSRPFPDEIRKSENWPRTKLPFGSKNKQAVLECPHSNALILFFPPISLVVSFRLVPTKPILECIKSVDPLLFPPISLVVSFRMVPTFINLFLFYQTKKVENSEC